MHVSSLELTEVFQIPDATQFLPIKAAADGGRLLAPSEDFGGFSPSGRLPLASGPCTGVDRPDGRAVPAAAPLASLRPRVGICSKGNREKMPPT